MGQEEIRIWNEFERGNENDQKVLYEILEE